MKIALELYLEGIPSGELELEMVRRAYSRTEIQIGLLALTLERMRAKQAARQDKKIKIRITALAVRKMVRDRWPVLPEVFTIKKLRDVLVAHGHDLPTNISRAANCALLQFEAEGRVKKEMTKASYKHKKVTLWTKLPTEPRRQDPASGVILAGDENPNPKSE